MLLVVRPGAPTCSVLAPSSDALCFLSLRSLIVWLSRQLDDYVHRIGRTGRAGRKASSIEETHVPEFPLLVDV